MDKTKFQTENKEVFIMDKIKIQAINFGKLNALCDTLKSSSEAKEYGKPAEHLREMYRLGDLLKEEAQAVYDCAFDALTDGYEHNMDQAISSLADAVETVKDLRDIADRLYDNYVNALLSLRDVTAPNGWAPIHSDEEVAAYLERGYAMTNSMTLGYNNGQYALLFEDDSDGETLLCEPFIIGYGDEDELDAVRNYVEGFLDMETEDLD